MPDDAENKPAAINHQSFKILDKAPSVVKGQNESIEEYMGRIHYKTQTVFSVGEKQYVDMDGNADGKIMPEEVTDALKNSPLATNLEKAKREVLQANADRAAKETPNQPITSIEALVDDMKQTIIMTDEKGNNIPAVKGKITEDALKKYDADGDGKVSKGEQQYYELQKVLNPPQPPQNLPRKPLDPRYIA